MMIDAGLIPNWKEIWSEPVPISSPGLVETWMRGSPRTPGAVGPPITPAQVTDANSYQPFGTRGQLAPSPAAPSQPLDDTRSLAVPADGSANADDAKDIRVLRRFDLAPDGSWVASPLPASDQPQDARPLGLFSGKPMANYPPPPIFGFQDRSPGTDDGDDFFSCYIKPLLQQ
jgi:hypothetical protein